MTAVCPRTQRLNLTVLVSGQVSDGSLKDERLNIAFIAFLTFITYGIAPLPCPTHFTDPITFNVFRVETYGSDDRLLTLDPHNHRLKIVVMELLPALPYTTLIEEYILYAIAFVAAVAASNSIMLTNIGYDDEDRVKLADLYSMWASAILWLFVRAVLRIPVDVPWHLTPIL